MLVFLAHTFFEQKDIFGPHLLRFLKPPIHVNMKPEIGKVTTPMRGIHLCQNQFTPIVKLYVFVVLLCPFVVVFLRLGFSM